MRVAAIIVNYRTPDMTAKAVTALLAELATVAPARLFLVDNDSGDGSAQKLRAAAVAERWGDRVVLIESKRNGGYGYGINVGVQRALLEPDKPDYFFVLNSDAFVNPGSMKALVDFMDGHLDAGIAGSPIYDTEGVQRVSAFRFPTALSELNIQAENSLLSWLMPDEVVSLPAAEETHEAEWISGVSMLVRRAVFEDVGGFDEGFFLYFEEVDFCRRARRAGWKSYSVVTAPMTHIGSVSTGMENDAEPMPQYWFDSRHRYFLKHHGWLYSTLSDASFATGVVLRRTKSTVLGRHRNERPRFLRDFVRHSVRNLTARRSLAPYDRVVESRAEDGGGMAEDERQDRRRPGELGLLEILAEDFVTHDRDPFEPGFWAVAVHRLGKRLAALRSPALRAVCEPGYKTLFTAVDWVWGIHLPRSVQLGRRVRIWHYGCMLLRARAIGNDVHIRQCTTFGPLRGSAADPEALPVIEGGADIGSGACIMGPVTIGRDAIVGANTLVLRDVPARASVLGVPARVIPSFGLPARVFRS